MTDLHEQPRPTIEIRLHTPSAAPMTSSEHEIESIRREADPIQRGKRATELITRFHQHAAELAHIRKTAIEQAHTEHDMTYTDIANSIGVTKSRISQVANHLTEPS